MNIRAFLFLTTFTLMFSYAKSSKGYLSKTKKPLMEIEPVSSITAFVDKKIIEKVKKRRERYFLAHKTLPPL